MKIFNSITRNNEVNITFIFGAPRGGTTWLWSLLEAHNGTIPFLNGSKKKSDGTYDSSESGVYIKDRKKAAEKIKLFILNNKGKIVFEKTPSHTLIYEQILKDFPESKNIVIFRNPFAIVNSMIKSEMVAFQNHNIEYSIQSVKEYYQKLEELSRIKGNLVITYENLLKQTKPILKSIFERLNLELTNIDNIIEKNKCNTRINVKGAFRKGVSDSYKEDLSDFEKIYIASALKSEIDLFESINDLSKC